MSKEENLRWITTRNDEPGRERSSVAEEKDTALRNWYWNLWRAFVANNNIQKEHEDLALVRFFQSIQHR